MGVSSHLKTYMSMMSEIHTCDCIKQEGARYSPLINMQCLKRSGQFVPNDLRELKQRNDMQMWSLNLNIF